MARYKVPSKAASGRDTFSDSLVGNQITDGSSQLTNTNFTLDRDIPEKDSKNFRTAPFSEFLTLDTLSKESDAPTTQSDVEKKNNSIKFKNGKNDTGKSLYGSLSSRLLVSITRIIKKFPAAFLLDKDGFISTSTNTASDIIYDNVTNRTDFTFELSKIYNPFEIVLVKPNSNTLPDTENTIRNFYSSYKKYNIELSGNSYNILNSVNLSQNVFKLTVEGNPFSGQTGYSENILIKPINGVIEEFFSGLDDVESQLLNRDESPLYTASFIVPMDSLDNSVTNLTTIKYNWPISKDGWNIRITGSDYDNYVFQISSIGNEIDNYKSNLIVRFLSSPQLFEFDTDDKKGESIFQLYGQSFDKVKKYIDNIAYMRNVSYDGINNLPDVLLKNLSETLGLPTVNLFDEKRFEEILYSRNTSQLQGEPISKNIVESEYEFYRRLLVNLAFIYKSKGTRSALHFFLRFLGAPEPLICIDEYVYNVTDFPNSKNLEEDINDLLVGGKVTISAVYNTGTTSYDKVFLTGLTTYNRSNYPVYEDSVIPRKAVNTIDDMYFQKGSGWYDVTLEHRASNILDVENSILTGRTKVLKTKMKPYTYGEDYFDVYRTLPGLDFGYELESVVDNKKTQLVDDNSSFILNRKNISIHLSPSRGIDYDIWRKSKELELTFGSNTLLPQTGTTFIEFLDKTIHDQIKNSNVIRYRKNYIVLEDVYNSYASSTGFTPYNFIDIHEFIKRMSPYWTEVISQLVPATTLWTGGNLITNSLFGRPKYQYQFDCQPIEIIEDLYPNFFNTIEEDLETILGDPENLRGLINLTGITYSPIIEIDGVNYSSATYSVVVSGTTNTSNSAKLFDVFPMTGCTILPSGSTTSLPLICDYFPYLTPDVDKIKELWVSAVTGLVENVVNTLSGRELVVYEIYVDNENVDKIKFTSIKHGQRDCSINDYFLYRHDIEYSPAYGSCYDQVDFCSQTEILTGNTGECQFVSDVTFTIENAVGIQNSGTTWPVYMYTNCSSDFNESILLTSGRTITRVDDCTFKIENVYEYDDIEFNVIDASNCETRVAIDGLQMKIEHDPLNLSHYQEYHITVTDTLTSNIETTQTGVTWCDKYTGYTLSPNIKIKNTINYGLKSDSYVYIVTGSTALTQLDNQTITFNDIITYIGNGQIYSELVSNVNVGDLILTAVNNDGSTFATGLFQDIPISGCSFTYRYSYNEVSSIECLGSFKKSIITGYTTTSGTTILEVLPTTKLRVYTNKKIENGVISDRNYYFTSRYPEDLQIKGTEAGDYMLDYDGFPVEVLDVNLTYCNLSTYYNFNLIYSGDTPDEITLFNGDGTNGILLSHENVPHSFTINNIKIEQYYQDTENCNTEPNPGEFERPIYPICP